MLHIFYLVFGQLAVGGFGLLLAIPTGLVGRGFFRLMGTIYFSVMALTRCADLAISGRLISPINFLFSWNGQDSRFVCAFLLISLCYTISLWIRSNIVHRVFLFVGTLLGLAWVFCSAQVYLENIDIPLAKFVLPFQFLVSSVLLGAVNSGMWFGHWYLVTPNLPIIHLQRFNRLFLISLTLSISLFLVNLYFRVQSEQTLPLDFFHQIAFTLRLLIGFGGSVTMHLLIWHCLRSTAIEHDTVGATRAATGFLYIAMLTVVTGEMFGRLLCLEIGFIL